MSIIPFPILLAAALGLSGAPNTGPVNLVLTPYDNLPKEVRSGVLEVIGDVLTDTTGPCEANPAMASKYAKSARVFRLDLNDDGRDDYILDEWSGSCFSNPAHYVHVWVGNIDGHFNYEAHAEASLLSGPAGFVWLQTRCNKREIFDFQLESYLHGVPSVSRCYPADDVDTELRRRGLHDPFPR